MLSLEESRSLAFTGEYSLIQLLLGLKQLLLEIGNQLIFVVITLLKLVDLDLAKRLRNKCTIALHFSIFDLMGQGFDFIFSECDFPLQLIELASCLIEDMCLLLVFLTQLAL